MPEETKLLDPPSLESSLRRRDYHWTEITPEEFAEMLTKKLKKIGAKAFLLDVYCSNDQIYRNLAVKWMGHISVKSLYLRFNRDEGKEINIMLAED